MKSFLSIERRTRIVSRLKRRTLYVFLFRGYIYRIIDLYPIVNRSCDVLEKFQQLKLNTFIINSLGLQENSVISIMARKIFMINIASIASILHILVFFLMTIDAINFF